MLERRKPRAVLLIGGTLGLTLSELKYLGFDRKNRGFVDVYLDDKKIIITRDPIDVLKPSGVSEDIWEEFLSEAMKLKVKTNSKIDKIIYALNDALKLWIRERRKKFIKFEW